MQSFFAQKDRIGVDMEKLQCRFIELVFGKEGHFAQGA
jgi:hypothetical protein